MIVVLDLETDCPDPEKANIVELGAVILTGDRIGETFSRELKLDIEGNNLEVCSIGAARVNGQPLRGLRNIPAIAQTVSRAFSTDAAPTQVILELLEWLDFRNNRSVTIAGINPHFDRRILLRYIEAAGVEHDGFIRHNLLDLHTIALRKRYTSKNPKMLSYLSSDPIFEALGLPAEPKPHSALQGAFWEACGFWAEGIGGDDKPDVMDVHRTMKNHESVDASIVKLFPEQGAHLDPRLTDADESAAPPSRKPFRYSK